MAELLSLVVRSGNTKLDEQPDDLNSPWPDLIIAVVCNLHHLLPHRVSDMAL